MKDLALPMPGKEIGTIMSLLNVGRRDAGAHVTWRPLRSGLRNWDLPAGLLWGMSSFFHFKSRDTGCFSLKLQTLES